MSFFVAGYMIVWVLVLLYTMAIQKGQNKLEQELKVLEELVYNKAK
ncbi:MAG: CcmD family protein [Firmicutes bacterium]|nr:CcmD family protein [Bacillota bacterium]